MRDLDDVVAADLEARERRLGGAAPAGVLVGLRRRVRRNRARRHAIRGIGTLAVVALLGSAGWWGMHHPAPVPAVTPLPTTTATPSAAASPAASPSLTASQPPLLAARLGLPPVHALPDTIWSSTGPGWALGVYRSLRASDVPASFDGTTPGLVDTLVLASPDGTLYGVRDLSEPVEVAAWQAGTTTVLLLDGRTMDLVTGDISGDRNGLPAYSSFLALGPGDRPLWRDGSRNRLAVGDRATPVAPEGRAPIASPDGSLVIQVPASAGATAPYADTFLVYDVATGRTRSVPFGVSGGDLCRVVAWTSSSSVLAQCASTAYVQSRGTAALTSDQAHAAFYEVPLSGAPTRASSLDLRTDAVTLPFGEGAHVSDGVVAFVGSTESVSGDPCDTGVYRFQGGRTTRLMGAADGPNFFSVRAVAGTVWVDQEGYCSGDETADVVTAFAPDGTSRIVFPSPPGELSDGDRWIQGLTSYVVAH